MNTSHVLKNETSLSTFTGLVSGTRAQALIGVMANYPPSTPSLDEFGLQASPQPTPGPSAASAPPRAHIPLEGLGPPWHWRMCIYRCIKTLTHHFHHLWSVLSTA